MCSPANPGWDCRVNFAPRHTPAALFRSAGSVSLKIDPVASASRVGESRRLKRTVTRRAVYYALTSNLCVGAGVPAALDPRAARSEDVGGAGAEEVMEEMDRVRQTDVAGAVEVQQSSIAAVDNALAAAGSFEPLTEEVAKEERGICYIQTGVLVDVPGKLRSRIVWLGIGPPRRPVLNGARPPARSLAESIARGSWGRRA